MGEKTTLYRVVTEHSPTYKTYNGPYESKSTAKGVLTQKINKEKRQRAWRKENTGVEIKFYMESITGEWVRER